MVKEEDSLNDSDASRTQFVLVAKPKFIKVESGNDNPPPPASPRKVSNLVIEPDDDDDAAVMKNSQSSDEGRNNLNLNDPIPIIHPILV